MKTKRTQPQAFSRMDRSSLGAWWWTVDRAMLGAVLMLVVFGVALVATASPSVAQKIDIPDDYHFLKRHIGFLIPSLMLMFGLSILSPRAVWRTASVILLVGVIGLIVVLLHGVEIKGARRWIAFGGLSLQPSEFIKPAFAVVAAWLIALQKNSTQRVAGYRAELSKAGIFKEQKNFPGYYVAIALYGVLITLLLKQPDLGMTVVLTSVFASQIFLAGLRFRYMVALLAIGSIGIVTAYFTFHHAQSRIDRFLNPDSGDNYQVDQSTEAIRAGGFFGVGPGQGSVKLALPDSHADFIFSVLAEEMGLLFVAILMAMFLYVLLRGFRRLQDSGDLFSILAVGGLLSMFGLQALIHMGSSVNILPAKGMTLPFISYGGSSMISMGMTMGMVLALTRRKKRKSIARGGMMMRRTSDKAENKEA